MKIQFSAFCFLLLLVYGCNTSKKTINTTPVATIDETLLDTLFVSAKKPEKLKTVDDYHLPVYHPTYTLKHDLIHTKLDLHFDWAKQHVIGKAFLTLKPYFYPSDGLTLDAKGFDIHDIKMEDQKESLKFEYDGQILQINLGKTFKANEKFILEIDYTAKPSEGIGGGSDAITSDKGLFFINHLGENPNKPMQIWTQGETENNSRWFPTIDKPNERCTQEIYLTVQDRFETLSNGLLISSDKNKDGTRTDYWKMDLPHAPYLFMIAVGEYAVIKDRWKDIEVGYYVEPDYKPYARDIFGNTIEMLDFFSNMLNVKYPWQKYSQIIVRDYVSGAMENTTGVIFGDFVQKTDRELIDNHNDAIVAHEMFHHWFGDYVTCESWSNLTMNEGFANYSEYLWYEHKYGKDEADQHRINELDGYLSSTQMGNIHPLIHFGYDDKEDMFDAHSYNKGGLILHMLRNYIGDEAFFASLQKYLEDNAFQAVEAHELRLAVEDITGEDFNWFFNQWFFSAGHPQLDISYHYDVINKQMNVTIEQLQDPEKGNPAIFILPMAVDIYVGKSIPIRKEIKMTKRKEIFRFNVTEEPVLVNVDADKILLCEKIDKKSEEAFFFQYYNAKNFQDRYEAISVLAEMKNEKSNVLLKTALNDNYWGLRRIAIESIDSENDPSILTLIAQLAEKDPRSEVRAAALEKLGETQNLKYADLASKMIDSDKAYNVISSGLSALVMMDENKALSYANKFNNEESADILIAVSNVYGMLPEQSHLPFFEKNWDNVGMFGVFPFFENYFKIVKEMDDSVIDTSMASMEKISTNFDENMWKRFAATRNIYFMEMYYKENGKLDKADKLRKMINEIVEHETDGQLKRYYQSFKS